MMKKMTITKMGTNNSTVNHMTGNGAMMHPASCGCSKCILPASYQFAEADESGECKFCRSFEEKTFAGAEKLIRDLNLKEGERLGITVSGGKDSIYMWGFLSDLLGADRIEAFCYYRPGITSEVAVDNVKKTQRILGAKLHIIEDRTAYPRFRRNLEILLEKPDPAAVRVLLCAGCRFGITGRLYEEGRKYGVTKYISGASYLELAPFKEELLAAKDPAQKNNLDAGFEKLISSYPELDYGNNLEIIKRDQHFKYKNNDTMCNQIQTAADIQLFDFDNYFENNPGRIESLVKERFGWRKTDRSWHFDCIVEDIKDVFYYGMLGYTEMDFKLSAMVRYGLLTREEAQKKVHDEADKLAHSYRKMRDTLHMHKLDHMEEKLKELYCNSPYLVMEEEKGEKIA